MPSDYPVPEPADAPYPAVRLLRQYGNWFAIGLGVLIAAGGLGLALSGGGAIWFPACVLAGAIAAFLMRSYVELVRIIADMLLPR